MQLLTKSYSSTIVLYDHALANLQSWIFQLSYISSCCVSASRRSVLWDAVTAADVTGDVGFRFTLLGGASLQLDLLSFFVSLPRRNRLRRRPFFLSVVCTVTNALLESQSSSATAYTAHRCLVSFIFTDITGYYNLKLQLII